MPPAAIRWRITLPLGGKLTHGLTASGDSFPGSGRPPEDGLVQYTTGDVIFSPPILRRRTRERPKWEMSVEKANRVAARSTTEARSAEPSTTFRSEAG